MLHGVENKPMAAEHASIVPANKKKRPLAGENCLEELLLWKIKKIVGMRKISIKPRASENSYSKFLEIGNNRHRKTEVTPDRKKNAGCAIFELLNF